MHGGIRRSGMFGSSRPGESSHCEGFFGSLGRFVWVIGKVCLGHCEGLFGSLGRFVWVIVEVCLGHCEGLFGSL